MSTRLCSLVEHGKLTVCNLPLHLTGALNVLEFLYAPSTTPSSSAALISRTVCHSGTSLTTLPGNTSR